MIIWKIYLLSLVLVVSSLNAKAQQQRATEVCYNPNLIKDTSKKSIKSMAFRVVDGDSIKINYHSWRSQENHLGRARAL